MNLQDALSDLIQQAHAADMLNVSRQRILALIKSGKLDVYEIDGKRFVSKRQVEARLKIKNKLIDIVNS
jgi:predicted DNA-binding protein YlxM (UPF0122 family)